MTKILLTGGGTAGHVTPNIAMLPKLKSMGYEIQYIGSYDGIEKKLIEDQGIPYTGIATGKLRRYLSIKNFTDPFKVLKGYREAKAFVKKYKPDIVFSKGGFVSVPVVVAAGKLKIPVIIHESDMTPGLANKISMKYATKICYNFPETKDCLPENKAVFTGTPIRQELSQGDKIRGLNMCGFTANKPVIMIIGGSQGAMAVNEAVRAALPELLTRYQIVHLCGKGKMDISYDNMNGYVQYEYIKEELKDLFAISDIVVSRAGANAIYELLALKKPSILIPLSLEASRGDQILNAESFERQGFSVLLKEEDMTTLSLIETIDITYNNRQLYIDSMNKKSEKNPIDTITELIDATVKNKK